MSDISTPLEVTDQLKAAYERAGAMRASRLQRICRRRDRKRWQRKYYFVDVDARMLVPAMLHVDAEGCLYRERGGGFGPGVHLIQVGWTDLYPYEKEELNTSLARLIG